MNKETVSILVLLEPPLIHKQDFHFFEFARVSILVLLEPPLILVKSKCGCNSKETSFNPCFTGTSSHTPISSEIADSQSCFNPCFTGTSSHT